MNILGISYLSHDSSAVLISDGVVIAMIEEERISRIKHDNSFPTQAIKYVLREGGIRESEIDIIAIPYKWHTALGRRAVYGIRNIHKTRSFFLRNVMPQILGLSTNIEEKIRGLIGRNIGKLSETCKVVFYEHHVSHAASTYLASPFDRSLIISWDGRGEWPCILAALGRGNKIEIIHREYFPNSIGQAYQAVSQYLGFSDMGDEYKVMGLSAYGEPNYMRTLRKFIEIKKGRISINQDYMAYYIYNREMADRFSLNMTRQLGASRHEQEPIEQRHMDIARSLQERVNEVGVEFARFLRARHGDVNLCLAGGVAQNIILNHKIYDEAGFDNVFVQPASHDAGLALGAALLACGDHRDTRQRFIMRETGWGPSFSSHAIRDELKNYGLSFVQVADVERVAARMIANGHVIGWFSGRSEFGPRALGHRSILADPRKPEMKDIVNRKIKFREEFRPFAPSVLAEHFSEYFSGAPVNQYMTFYSSLRNGRGEIIPAVTHVDGSARPQAVFQDCNPAYWRLIDAFRAETGVPVVLNTSFNVKGEPIANSPGDAIRCFFSTGIDFLVLEDCIVFKRNKNQIKEFLRG